MYVMASCTYTFPTPYGRQVFLALQHVGQVLQLAEKSRHVVYSIHHMGFNFSSQPLAMPMPA